MNEQATFQLVAICLNNTQYIAEGSQALMKWKADKLKKEMQYKKCLLQVRRKL